MNQTRKRITGNLDKGLDFYKTEPKKTFDNYFDFKNTDAGKVRADLFF